jgi:hypothetical protein
MTARVLEQLHSEGFLLSLAFVSTPGPLRRVLSRRQEVRMVREALRQGAITEATIRRFVSDLMRDFRPGKQFLHELPLAALAVAMETRATDFAEEFLHDLSRLRSAEMGLCIRVARECLKRRTSVPGNTAKTFSLSKEVRAPRLVCSPDPWIRRIEAVGLIPQNCVLGAI